MRLGSRLAEAHAQSNPVIHPYQGTDEWARLPDGRIWGAPTGVEMDPDQESVWILERCGDYSGPGCAESDLPAILKFDSSGTLVQSFGAGMFIFPHGLAVDHEGNVYVADGRGQDGKGHTITKFTPRWRAPIDPGPARCRRRRTQHSSIGRPMSRWRGTGTFSWPTDTPEWTRTCAS